MSVDTRRAEDLVRRAWDGESRRMTRGQIIEAVYTDLSEEERERIVRDWIANRIWKLHKEKQARIRKSIREASE